MFGTRTAADKLIQSDLAVFGKTNSGEFPTKGKSRLSMRIIIRRIARSMAYQKKHFKIGYLFKYPVKEAVAVWQRLLPFSPNNLGNWSRQDNTGEQISEKIEGQLIRQMTDLYGGETADCEGYVTAGATEGNIFCAWLGRNDLLKSIDKPPVLIVNSLTHYSIAKAGNLLGLKQAVCPVGRKWSFDRISLRTLMTDLNRSGCESFLLPLTVGYTFTGTADDIDEITEEVRELEDTLKIRTFIWVDAALSGMIEPFIGSGFLPLKNRLINGLVVDFHKYAGVPYPAGLVLYRKRFRRSIERHVGYLDYYDSTLLGSRTGIAAIACWYMINRLGRKGYAEDIKNKLERKRRFIEEISKYKGVEVTTSEYSLNCGVVYHNPKDDWTNEIERKYGVYFRRAKVLTLEGHQDILIARAYFL
jgi:glutamate/tyrosine decarboxylase-like PLP-dependent enzyme